MPGIGIVLNGTELYHLIALSIPGGAAFLIYLYPAKLTPVIGIEIPYDKIRLCLKTFPVL